MNRSLTTLALIFISLLGFGQKENPVKWEFTSHKKADQVYEIVLSAHVEKPWHIYSQFTPGGGPLPTTISYSLNPLLQIDGASVETGKLQTNHDETFGVDVKYFSDQVAFVQKVKVKKNIKTGIRGNIEYMVCNDKKCLPPVKQTFDIQLQ